jgi:murein DD-endopeptidase MepM/ murein hydrolase activator NlpD
MHSVAEVKNEGWVQRFRLIVRSRDLFVHDGASLRRVQINPKVQIGFLAATVMLFAWSLFAAFQFLIGMSAPQPNTAELRAHVAQMQSEVARMEIQVAAKAALLEERQSFLDELATARYKATEAELRRLGLKASRFKGQGGPFEALLGDKAPQKDGDPQFRSLFLSWKKLDQLEQGVISIPSSKPVSGANFTSGFGVRSDPFRGSAAMHAGIDLAGPIGTPIYATADGVVGRAEWANGYGNLVELEHGKGIQTRYGHLSKILVKPNTRIKRGDKIALMGSTGRSTGSHLHYEVRIDGRAVNPVPFLQSSDYLLAVQRRAEATQVALGGPDN